MERRLKTISELLTIGLNFMVILGLETAADVIVGGLSAPLYALMLPLLLPVIFYAARRWAGNLLFFLLIHGAAAYGLVYLANFTPFPLLWKIVFAVVSGIYVIASLRIRLTYQEDGEGELTPGFMAAVAAVLFLVCSYLGSDAGCSRILWLALLWLPGHWIRMYLDNFLDYMRMNRQAAGAMPEERILRGGILAAGIYSIVSLAVLAACAQTSLVAWMSEMVRKAGFSALKLFFFLLSLLPETKEEPLPAAQEAVENMSGMALPAAEEAPMWLQILDKILVTAVAVLILAGLAVLLVMLVRYVIRSFYGRERIKKEIRRDDFVEEEERLSQKKETSKMRLPVIGGTPSQRVRKIFKRTVKAAFPDQDNVELAAKTVRELAQLCIGAQEESAQAGAEKKREAWAALTALYERARYTESQVTAEDVREAGKLSRIIGH